MGPKIGLIFVLLGFIFWTIFLTVLGSLWGPFWGPFGGQIGPRRGQDGLKRAIKSFKDPKICICKNLKKPAVFQGFWGPRLPKTASKSPRRLPRGTQRAPKPEKKGFQKWTPKLLIFGPVLGPFWGPFWVQNWLQKRTKNGTTFGNPRCRLSGVQMT